MKGLSRSGFTMMEVMVVCLILGILAALAIPQYIESVETAKANDAAGKVDAIAHAHRMYLADRGRYIEGEITTACNSGACGAGDSCDIIRCKYLAPDDWDTYPYKFKVCDPTFSKSPSCPTGTIAYAPRKTPFNCPGCNGGTSKAPYTGWNYLVSPTGIVANENGAPPPP